jgi:peptidyl-dipeptidase Dcp
MHARFALPVAAVAALALVAGSAAMSAETNPLLAEWTTPFGVPPFDRIEPEHFPPAFAKALAEHGAEIAAIASRKDPPTFANTVEALDRSGGRLAQVSAVFNNLSSAETSPALQAIAREIAPKLAAHRDDIALNPALFRRVDALWEARASLELDPDQARLLEDRHKDFVRGGVRLDPAGQARLRAINAELASLSVRFGENLLEETNRYRMVVDRAEDLAGLPDRVRASAADAAKRAGLEGRWVFTLHAPSFGPFMQYAANRALRQRLFEAYVSRADHGEATDNKAIASRTAALRAERARLLGYETHAHYVLDENMAKTPARVQDLLDRVWEPAKRMAAREVDAMAEFAKADGITGPLEAWDRAYYAEKVRMKEYAIDEDAVRPYFPLERVRDGAFHVAQRLYGLTFTERTNVPVYHPEVRAFEVTDADGSHLAVFYVDYHPRPGKRSGAWSNRYRDTWSDGRTSVRPVVSNVCNFSRPAGDAPALLSMGEVETLFHEFGHALHSILSRVRYRGLGSTPRDFVEMPSQILENWATEPEVLAVYARHWKTGEPIPAELVERIKRSRTFHQGHATVEYTAASLLDMRWHTLADTAARDAAAFEAEALASIGMPAGIPPRYRTPYFQHIFAGGYSSGYYSYLWSEVLDADAFEVFKEKGIFDPATARSFRTNVLERGGSEDAMKLYLRFRGREPSVEPLLRRRGLVPVGG